MGALQFHSASLKLSGKLYYETVTLNLLTLNTFSTNYKPILVCFEVTHAIVLSISKCILKISHTQRTTQDITRVMSCIIRCVWLIYKIVVENGVTMGIHHLKITDSSQAYILRFKNLKPVTSYVIFCVSLTWTLSVY